MSNTTGRLMAEFVKIIHFVWIALAIAALPAVFLWPAVRPYITVAVVVMLGVWLFTRDCPLRALEHRLRLHFHPEGAHGGGFFYHHIGRHIGLSPTASKAINIGYSLLILVALIIT